MGWQPFITITALKCNIFFLSKHILCASCKIPKWENTWQATAGLEQSKERSPFLCSIWWEHVFVHSDVTLPQTSTKVSAQMRERTLRTAVVPFPRRPTLHWRLQHSELEQDCRKKDEGVGRKKKVELNLNDAVVLKTSLLLLISTYKITANEKVAGQFGWTNNSLVNTAG